MVIIRNVSGSRMPGAGLLKGERHNPDCVWLEGLSGKKRPDRHGCMSKKSAQAPTSQRQRPLPGYLAFISAIGGLAALLQGQLDALHKQIMDFASLVERDPPHKSTLSTGS